MFTCPIDLRANVRVSNTLCDLFLLCLVAEANSWDSHSVITVSRKETAQPWAIALLKGGIVE